ncbi:hypothetical protein SAMN05421743_102161 [Thalassobacillus cyri]|uniref:Uncharacterized protein n=1 Tax=Thalassobacillus cyri TaxID=571932 RepID=A0A1H3XID9_9BACI|nr:hypothetical protein [Thalassobacillus cyri]SDZ99083.1 hypothetical protein SAMN05421743_102161 [Thalassobacillus cyri]
MRKLVFGVLFAASITGMLAVWFPSTNVMNKLLIQLFLPLAAIYWINKTRYWFHHHIKKSLGWSKHPLIISLLFLVISVGYDLSLFTGHLWALPIFHLLMLVSAFLFWCMFVRAGRNIKQLSFALKSLFLVVNMLVLGVYAFIASHYFPSYETSIYTFIGSIVLVMTFLLGYTLMMWGRKEHVVDRRTVEGLVRKLK